MQPQKASSPSPTLAETIANDTIARERVTVTDPPEGNEDGESLAVTLEHPGRYGGPRRGGRPTDEPIELGRGGIGRVLIAHDQHLGREVAVKELLTRADGPAGSRSPTNPRESLAAARFLREARLTGQLEHPNIVPVYELGTRSDGTLYYTMKVVRGRNLASALEAAKGEGLAARLRYLNHYADLCDAIAYAHSRGVIHRDIKPENVMVGEFGETVVLDWGLAKPKNAKDLVRGGDDADGGADRAHPARSAPTEPPKQRTTDAGKGLAATDDGTLLGTPMYMSPEQAQGDLEQIDERSDVWALGVVLYEILTGEPPFWGKTAIELLLKVVGGNYPKVAERTPEAPPELAAIAEKALSRNPAYRYPDARAMAEEVRAYLTGGRVQAFNYRPWTLVKRWAGKHKAVLTVAALGLAALVGLGVYSYVEIAEERDRAMAAEADAVRSMNAATAEKARAENAEAEAKRSRDSAESLVRYLLSDLKDRLEPLGQLALLDGVARAIDKHYDDTEGAMAEALEDAARVRNRAAVTALMGDLARARGDLGAATKAYDLAEFLRVELLRTSDLPEHRADRADSHRQRGLLLRMRGDLAAAQAELVKAREIRAALFAVAPESLPYRRALVQSELDRGDLATLLGDLRQAETAFVAAVDLARGLVRLAAEASPELEERARFDLSIALDGLGLAHLDKDEIDQAKAAFDESLALREALLDKRPSNLEWRYRLAVSHARAGEIAELQGQLEEAQKRWQRAASITERLIKQDPENARWARDLAVDLNHLGDVQLMAGAPELALESFTKALEQLRALATKEPSNAELQRDVEVGENRRGEASLALGKLPEALASFEGGLAVAERLASLDPSNTRWLHDLAHGSGRVALVRARRGDLVTAKPLAARAVAMLEVLVEKDPTNSGWAQDLAAAKRLVTAIDNGGPFDGGLRPTQPLRRDQGLAAPVQEQRPDDTKKVESRPPQSLRPRPQPIRPAPAASPEKDPEPKPLTPP